MNDKVKSIFKYLSVGFVGFFLGISTLIFVSSCNQRNNTLNQSDNKKSLVKKSQVTDFNEGATFTFSPDFNYNAFFQSDTKSYLKPDDIRPISKYPFIAFGDLDHVNNSLIIETDNFICEGLEYNRFKVRYFMASTDLNFYNVDNKIIKTHLIDNINPYVYFYSLSFQHFNIATNSIDRELMVCSREKFANSEGTYINYNATWINSSYRTITSAGDEWNGEYKGALMILEMCNNFSEITGFDNGISDVGLGSVFTLLTSAFYSLIPFLSIQIIPGVTLGLLLFIPLIVSIISLVVWLVKK